MGTSLLSTLFIKAAKEDADARAVIFELAELRGATIDMRPNREWLIQFRSGRQLQVWVQRHPVMLGLAIKILLYEDD